MADLVPNTNTAATTMNPVSNPDTEHGHPLPDAAHDFPPGDNEKEKGDPLPDSSNASSQLKPGSDAAVEIEPNGPVVVDEKAPPGDQPEQARKITGIKWVLVVSSILSSTFLFALDNTVVADIQPKILERLGEIQKLPWLSVGLFVASLSTNLMWYVDGSRLRLDCH